MKRKLAPFSCYNDPPLYFQSMKHLYFWGNKTFSKFKKLIPKHRQQDTPNQKISKKETKERYKQEYELTIQDIQISN